MHEIKSPFLILMEEQSYLAQSLESAFEKQNVKNTSGNILVSGEFFEFLSGRNKLHIVNSNSQNMTAEISYTPYFMYGEHFDDLEWGDGNA